MFLPILKCKRCLFEGEEGLFLELTDSFKPYYKCPRCGCKQFDGHWEIEEELETSDDDPEQVIIKKLKRVKTSSKYGPG